MLTLRATLEPDGRVTLPEAMRHARAVPILVTFLEDPAPTQASGSAAAALALLQSPTFRTLPKADAEEIAQRIAQLRADWGDE